MAIMDYGTVDNIRNDLSEDRNNYISKWQETAECIAPNWYRNSGWDRGRGDQRNLHILKNKAGLALRTFTSGMMNGATSQTSPWWKFTTVDPKLRNRSEVKRYFTACEEIINAHFQVSNLYRVLPTSYKNVALFSNSCFAMLPHAQLGFYFYQFMTGTYAFGTNHEGRVNSFSREFSMTVRQIVERYAKLKNTGHIDWTDFDPWVRSMWEAARYEEYSVLANVIVPNPKPEREPIFSEDKLFQSYTYMRSYQGDLPNQNPSGFAITNGNNTALPDHGKFLSVRGYDYFPIIAPRWEVPPEDNYGVDGPGEMALGYVKSLQEKESYRLEAIAKLVKPPMVGPAALRRHQASILAGGITYVNDEGQGSFKPAFMVDPKLVELVNNQAEDIQDIGECFYENLFLMLAQDKPTSHVTAREIEERAGEKLQAISPVLGQLDQDQNGPLIENAFIMLNMQGKLPPPPEILRGGQIKPEYISTLAQAAKSSMMATAERFLNFTASASQALNNPALMAIANEEEMVRRYADWAGLDPNLIKTRQEFEMVKGAIAQQQAQAAQMEREGQAAATAKDLSQAKTGEGSMLDREIDVA